MRKHIIGGLALVLAAIAAPMTAEALTADCTTDPSNALGIALAVAVPGDVIEIQGTCTESVEIRTDDLTIQGVGDDDSVVGQLSVDAARRITIQVLEIQGAPGLHGITAGNNATITVNDVVIKDVVDGFGVILTSNASGVLNHVTIQDSSGGVAAEGLAKVTVTNDSKIENITGVGVIALGGAAAYLHQVTVREAGEGVRATEHSYVEILFGSLIEDNGGIGFAVDLGSTGQVADATIQNNGDSGIVVANGSTALITVREAEMTYILGNSENGVDVSQDSSATVTNSTIQNNGRIGINIDESSGNVFDSMILNNGATAISVFRGSSAVIERNEIDGNSEGIGLNTQAIGWLADNTISTSSTDDDALFIGFGSSARMNGGNTITSPVSAIFLRQGATLNQRNDDVVNGPVTIDALSNAEFRNVSITASVEVVDHSLLRFRDQSGSPSHVSVSGNTTVSLDSGLNFIGSFPVKVVGNITCLDQESSVSKGTLSLTGKITCTGY